MRAGWQMTATATSLSKTFSGITFLRSAGRVGAAQLTLGGLCFLRTIDRIMMGSGDGRVEVRCMLPTLGAE